MSAKKKLDMSEAKDPVEQLEESGKTFEFDGPPVEEAVETEKPAMFGDEAPVEDCHDDECDHDPCVVGPGQTGEQKDPASLRAVILVAGNPVIH